MRRKEALYKIKSILDNLTGNCGNNLKAEVILSELERCGMIPPKIQKFKSYIVRSHNLELLENVNEWEET
jgi:hypothetical protein